MLIENSRSWQLDKRVVFLVTSMNVELIFSLVLLVCQRWWFSHQALRLVEARGGWCDNDPANAGVFPSMNVFNP